MIKKLINKQKIAIYGMGVEGRSTLNYLKRHNYNGVIYLVDDNEKKLEQYVSKNIMIADKKIFDTVDCIIKSPGIILEDDFKYNDKLTSQTRLFLSEYSDITIGITGTKGKSTTTSFIYHLFKTNNNNAYIAGNIGKPVLDIIDELNNDSIVVYEMSCHQLQDCYLSPKYAIFLNCYEEHLDRYHTYENYFKAKNNIYKYQTSYDYVYINEKLPVINYKSNIIKLNEDFDDNILQYKDYKLSLIGINNPLLGRHNLFDINVAYKIAKDFNISDEVFIKALESFKPLSHRLEKLGKYKDIVFYNDSISTSAESTIAAIKSINDLDVVILGGLDRGIDYHLLLEEIKDNDINKYIFMYASGKRMIEELKETNKKVYYVDDLEKAVIKAYEIAKPNKVVLLSPASASYDSFKNFEERGAKYHEFIKKYAEVN